MGGRAAVARWHLSHHHSYAVSVRQGANRTGLTLSMPPSRADRNVSLQMQRALWPQGSEIQHAFLGRDARPFVAQLRIKYLNLLWFRRFVSGGRGNTALQCADGEMTPMDCFRESPRAFGQRVPAGSCKISRSPLASMLRAELRWQV